MQPLTHGLETFRHRSTGLRHGIFCTKVVHLAARRPLSQVAYSAAEKPTSIGCYAANVFLRTVPVALICTMRRLAYFLRPPSYQAILPRTGRI